MREEEELEQTALRASRRFVLFMRANHQNQVLHIKQSDPVYRGTSLTRKRTPLRPYRRPMPRVLGGSQEGGRFVLGEVPL